MDDLEIMIAAIEVLNKAFGPAAPFKFMTMLYPERTDYVEISRRIYWERGVDEIFGRASSN